MGENNRDNSNKQFGRDKPWPTEVKYRLGMIIRMRQHVFDHQVDTQQLEKATLKDRSAIIVGHEDVEGYNYKFIKLRLVTPDRQPVGQEFIEDPLDPDKII